MSREIMLMENKEGSWQEPFATICIESKEEFDKLNKALEKQIPKKVIYHDNCGNETPYQSRCPKCYEAINDTWYWAGESWCPYCGQKLDWGD